MPTSRGWTVAAIGVILLASGRLFGGRGAEQLGFALAVLVVMASGIVLLKKRDLLVQRSVRPHRAKVGQSVEVSLRVSNRGRPVTSLVLIEDQVSGGLSNGARFALSGIEGHGHRDAGYVLRPSRRGRYLVGPTRTSFMDPFGLARLRTSLADPSTLLVHPRVEPLSMPRDLEDRRSVSTSALRQPTLARGEDFYTLREYVEGDDLRRVHWPSTAKRDRYMIRQEETPFHTKATIVLDDRRGGYPAELFERAIEAAASLAYLYDRSGYSFRLVCASRRGIGFGRGAHHLTRCLDLLAMLSPQGSRRSLLERLAELDTDTKAQAALALVSADIGQDEAVSLVRTGRHYKQVSAVAFGSDESNVEVARLLDRSGVRAVTVAPDGSFARAWDRAGAKRRGGRWDLKRALA